MDVATLLFTILISSVLSSECELSEWSAWSTCYGTCYYAVSVRNRDVIRPSLPDNSLDGVKRCAQLYETRHCIIQSCQRLHFHSLDLKNDDDTRRAHEWKLDRVSHQFYQDSPVATVDLPSRSDHHRSSVKVIFQKKLLHRDRSHLENEAQLTTTEETMKTVLHKGKKRIIHFEDIRGRTMFGDHVIRRPKVLEQHPNASASQDLRNEVIVQNESKSRYNMKENDQKTQDFIESPITSDNLPKHLKLARQRITMGGRREWKASEESENQEKSKSSVQEAIRELESSALFKIPIDETLSRRKLHQNKILMKALIEAHQLRTTSNTSNGTTTPFFVNITTDMPKTEAEGDPVTVTTSTIENGASVSEGASSTANETLPSISNFTTDELFVDEPTDITASGNNTSKNPNGRISTEARFRSETHSDDAINNTEAADVSYTNSSGSFSVKFRKDLRDSIESTFVAEDDTKFNTTKTIDGSDTAMRGDKRQHENTSPLPELSNSSKSISTMSANLSASLTSSTMTTPVVTTSPLPYWPKKISSSIGYVPNTRKHASEITSKLYMTQEIIQALSDSANRRSPILRLDCLESRRCCKVTRTECSDGSTPKYVKRYYRPRGSENCLPYYYPRCSQNEEMDEKPIEYIQNCQDICFRGPEKHISPLTQVIIDN